MHQYIYESSLTGAFRFLLIMLIIYFIYSFVVRYLIPAAIRNTMKNFQQNYNPPHQNTDYQKRPEGEVSIHYVDKENNKGKTDQDGEYVDYEEVK